MSLLDKIAEYSCVFCLSDLRINDVWKTSIRLIKPSAYPLKDWNEAILYLCYTDKHFDTAEDAKQFLMRY